MTSVQRGLPPAIWPGLRLAVGTTASCAALALSFIPAATARPDHSRPGSGGAANPGAAANNTQPAAQLQPQESGGQGTPGSERHGAGRERHGSEHHEAPGATGYRERHAGEQPAGPDQSGAGLQQNGGANQGTAAAQTGAGVGSQVRHGAGRERHGSEHHERKDTGRQERRGRSQQHSDSQGSAPPSVSSGKPETAKPSQAKTATRTAATASPGPAAGASALAAPAAITTAPAASPPLLAGAATQTVVGHSRHATARARHTAKRAASRGPVLHVPGPVAAAAIASTVSPAGTKRPENAARHSRTPVRPSPIVTTITRIVGVVPTPVWAAIGTLLALAFALAVRSRLAALRARRLEKQRSQLLEDVGLLQSALLPVIPSRLGPVGTSVAYRPAAGPGAGGDFYDVFALEDGQLAIIVGDLSGHGRQALPHTALVRFTLRAYLEAGLSPREALRTAGSVLERQLGGSLATVVVATYQPRDRILVYASAGHPPPLVLGLEGRRGRPQANGAASAFSVSSAASVTACSSPPIGAGIPTGTRQTVLSIPGKARVCFHTDGVTESRVGGELFGSQRLAQTLAGLGPGATAAALLDNVADATDTRGDDMAACLLCLEGGASAPVVLQEELLLGNEAPARDRTEDFLLACGLERLQAAELIGSAELAAGRAGSMLLVLRYSGGLPVLTLAPDNVAPLHAHHARRQADLRVSR
jgi:serine phosphatase RsbU (regulator of sigma subunit)